MKINLPVTQREILVPQNTYLVSQTDMKGVITDANEAFVAMSGFTRAELIGSNHHLVRHPDMPAAAFGDLWASVKAGMPWRGTVKNRAKTGDHYWVDAQIVPIFKNGEVTGYMSVRRAPTRQQVAEAETLYAKLREKTTFPQTKRRPLSLKLMMNGLLGLSVITALVSKAVLFLDTPAWIDHAAGLLAVALTIPPIIMLNLWIFRPLEQIGRNIGKFTEGDLATRYPVRRQDEIGLLSNAFLNMQTRWLVSIDHIREAIRDSLQSVEDANKQSGTINEHIHTQHDRVASVAAATEEFCQAVAEVASSAAETSRAASKSEERVAQSRQTVQAGMTAAETVVSAVTQSHANIAELDQAVGKIGDITQVIKEIAEQTNLLALNAAIEAARAGESGRGFAVVADEVRKLAERTAGSTQEINQMVSGIQQLAGEVVTSMDQAASAVQTSSGKMRDSVDGLGLVAEASIQTVAMAEHIANASDQQNIAGQEVARNMEVISHLSEENQQLLEHLWQSMEALRGSVTHIDEAVSVFKTQPH
ncbi:MAG: PAS domain-containing methyl-accepting chemotaxis protein [Formivibrio sp.]|nr:PAS domain-containing methyl-accepting chemotaxis protein [Formivibrio sp.]